ncbi:MAG: hypothetical protein HY221_01105 [Candidatus Sungbacteria bacterium]|uniref:YCII-related domain-containing protein n=1 Tax=Candidatus Sungiibacteriota bacterium TaxID=2750080 RepID=A0A932QY09_9BACT|nr:hypothetical protein [Candidatus Sungbacteria bacterium]
MKQFIIIAYDYKDDGAYERRMAARTAHMNGVNTLRANGNIACGIAITDDNEKMIGSVMVMNFPSREQFDTWLKTEPYVTGKVWDSVTVLNGKLPPAFEDLILKKAA